MADASGGASGLRLPPGLGRPEPSGSGAPAGPPRPSSLADTLRHLDERLAQSGPRGVTTGTGQQMGPLFFDPEGADFTAWINHFKNEVYRNWIIPQTALLGLHGHVDLEFTVERDGRLTNLRILKSAGNASLDRAAENALLSSRLMPLPGDFAPPRVTMQVSFFYNEGPQGS
jgi:TonB family protein